MKYLPKKLYSLTVASLVLGLFFYLLKDKEIGHPKDKRNQASLAHVNVSQRHIIREHLKQDARLLDI